MPAHACGPHFAEAGWAVNDAAQRVRQVWAALQRPPLAGRSTPFVVSDHGFAEYLDVAPTTVRLLGIERPTAEGRVLSEMLDDTAR